MFQPELELSETDKILFVVSEEDLSKREILLETDRELVLVWYYRKCVKKLNELKLYLLQLKKVEEYKHE